MDGSARSGNACSATSSRRSDRDRAEGFAHLADQVTMFLGWAVRHADPYHPHFQRHNDLSGQWGGPNLDNVYKHARIDPSARYRITGAMHSCEDFILAVRVGFMHMPDWGTLAEVSASDLGIGPGDEFELFLGGEPRDGRWIDLPDGASMVSIREYYVDWQAGGACRAHHRVSRRSSRRRHGCRPQNWHDASTTPAR